MTVALASADRDPTISGKRALGLVLLIMLAFGGVVAAVVYSREWRQTERLVAAGLRDPRGVALVGDALVVAEAGVPGAPGRLTWIAEDSRGTLYDNLPGAVAIAAAPDQRILLLFGVCERTHCRSLQALDRGGQLAKMADLTVMEPAGLAVAPDGSVYVADATGGKVVRIDASGAVSPFAEMGGQAEPRGLAVSPEGDIYAALAGAGRVVRLASDGRVSTAVDGLSRPVDVGFEPDGSMLVLDQGTGRLLRLDTVKPIDRQVVSSGFDRPTSLLVVPDGRTYVTVSGALIQIRRLGPQPPRRVM